MSRKDFKKHNEPFVCKRCGHSNPPSTEGERNHCRKCLYSLHVDDGTPGDRASECGGLMMPVGLEHKGAKGYMLVHECDECGKRMLNKATEDDEGLERLC